RHALVWFNLGAVPAGSTISSADLALFCGTTGSNGGCGTTSNAEQIDAHRVIGAGSAQAAWTNSATWNKYDSCSTCSWTTPGGDRDSGILDYNTTAGATSGPKDWNHQGIQQVVDEWVNQSGA